MELTMDEFIQMGKKHTTSMHSYPEVPPLPEGFQKPKSYVEILEEEVRGDIPDRVVTDHIR